MSFLSRVLFPAPEGPLSTTGLGPAIAEGKKNLKLKELKEHVTAWVLKSWVTEEGGVPVDILVALKDFAAEKH